jgi:hypothetical protein
LVGSAGGASQTTDVIDKDLFEGFRVSVSLPFLCSAEASRFSVL